MSHKDALQSMIPLDLGGIYAADLVLEGAALDIVQAAAESLLDEMSPLNSYATINDWERVTGLVTDPDEPIQRRRDKIVRKLQEIGDIKKPYYTKLALALGYEVYIQEYIPTMSDWVGAGDELITNDDPAILFVWNAHIFNQSVYHFNAGQSAAGERLTWWRPTTELETIFEELRPAHVRFLFSYE